MKLWLCILFALCVVACRQPPVTEAKASGVEIKEYPLMPMELFIALGAIQQRRAPMYTFDRKYRAATYTAEGQIRAVILEVNLFPTDVIAVYLEGMEAPQVFLGQSPNSGCILTYDGERNVFSDPCYGSTFDVDGTYIEGPAQQDLDRLPSEVRDEVLWIRNEIIYGTVKIMGRDN